MKKAIKFILLTLGALTVIGIIAAIFSGPSPANKNGGSDNAASPDKEVVKTKSYVKVIEFTGDGKKKSNVFELHGNHAHLKYSYKSESSDIGVFSVYVTPDGEDVMETGGVPEVMSSATHEDTESAIQKPAGKYYLDVNAVGKWTIVVEEEQ